VGFCSKVAEGDAQKLHCLVLSMPDIILDMMSGMVKS